MSEGPSSRSRLVQRHDERQDYETPPEFFAAMEREFGPFDLDVCAVASTAKVARFFSPEQDGLKQDWRGVCWMNPPYGRATAAWVHKARVEAEKGARVVCLLPARTDTRWWHDDVIPHAKVVRFLKGRVKFWLDGAPARDRHGRRSGGKFPSAVVVFG